MIVKKVLQLYFFLLKFLSACSHTEIHISNSFPIGLTGGRKANTIFFNNSISTIIVFIRATVKYFKHISFLFPSGNSCFLCQI